MSSAPDDDVALEMRGVGVTFDGTPVLADVDWTVRRGERWVVLGRNGSGKTTLVRVASLQLHPSTGTVRVLGETLGRTDVRVLRRRIGLTSAAVATSLRPALTAVEIVMTAKNAALEPWWHTYDDADRRRARDELDRLGVGHLGDRRFGTLSSGERQRVLLARTLMTEPGLVLLDEPTAGLDLAGREDLVGALDTLAADPASPPVVLVTHHLEEVPASFTHALLVTTGRVGPAGPIEDVLTAGELSTCFGLALTVSRRAGRWSATALTAP